MLKVICNILKAYSMKHLSFWQFIYLHKRRTKCNYRYKLAMQQLMIISWTYELIVEAINIYVININLEN